MATEKLNLSALSLKVRTLPVYQDSQGSRKVASRLLLFNYSKSQGIFPDFYKQPSPAAATRFEGCFYLKESR